SYPTLPSIITYLSTTTQLSSRFLARSKCMKQIFWSILILCFCLNGSDIHAQERSNITEIAWNRDGTRIAGVDIGGIRYLNRQTGTSFFTGNESISGYIYRNIVSIDWHPAISNLMVALDNSGKV